MLIKKFFSAVAIIITCTLFSACNNNSISEKENENKESKISLSSYQITKTDYDNLDISDIKVDFPEINEYHNIKLIFQNNMTIDERIEIIKKMSENMFPEHKYSDDFLYWWGEIPNAESGTYPDGWAKYPEVSKYKDEITALNYNNGSFLYESDAQGQHEHDAYFLLNPNTLTGTMIKGTGRKITEGEYEHLAGWFPVYSYEKTERINIDEISDNSYKLYDETVSVKNAVDYANKFFTEIYLPLMPNTQIYPVISAVDICKYNDIYGYRFLIKNTFEGIPFDYTYDLGTVSKMSDGNSYSSFTNEAFMAKKDDIDFYYMQQPFSEVEYNGDSITEIISLDNALKLTSERLTKNVTFEVKSAEFVYCPLAKQEDSNETTAEASWRIEAYNPNDSKTYMVYVNATDGNIRYYTRQ